MENARKLYKKTGFQEINTRLGNTGHYSCQVWMYLELKNPVYKTGVGE